MSEADYLAAVDLCRRVVDAHECRDGGPTVAGHFLRQVHDLVPVYPPVERLDPVFVHVPADRVVELIGDGLTDYALSSPRRAEASSALGAPGHVARYLAERGFALVELPPLPSSSSEIADSAS